MRRQPQQPKSRQSPILRVTLVGGMRYLCTLPSATEEKSSPEVGTAAREVIQSLPPPSGMDTRWYVLGSIHIISPRKRSACASRFRT